MDVRWHASPNFGARRNGLRPTLVVIHYTAMKSCQAALDRLCDPVAEVSSHYLISEKGDILQLVEEDQRAWHAGQSEFRGRERCNDFSIGIELEGTDTLAYSDAQYAVLAALVAALRAAYPTLHAAPIVGHSDIAPGRKTDPGPAFDWSRLDTLQP
ncbi:MAG: 1,6-anhydro-N-acetylmuramyl-L-alanine amidase AmpD [Pseudomonadota bacterium]